MTAAYDPTMTAYFERLSATRFGATASVQGAWNTAEQHIAPALGLLTHTVEQNHLERHPIPLTLSRLAFDILGTLPLDNVEIDTRVIRPGRTIELVEATLTHDDRPAVILRAWFQATPDTSTIAGTDLLPRLADPDQFEPWEASAIWPGEFVRTVEVRRRQLSPGRAQFWLRPRIPLLRDERVSTTARAMSILDIANGVTPRRPPTLVAFPNLDTTVHLFQPPRSEWVGYDTTVAFGADGIGLTHSVLYDAISPIGTAQQILTVRPR